VGSLTIYYRPGRLCERIAWLMEELELPYEFEFARGSVSDLMMWVGETKSVAPTSPAVLYGDLMLVESGAIIDLILSREAPDRLRPALDSPDYPMHLMWMHYAEGTLAAQIFSDYRAWNAKLCSNSLSVASEACVQFAENHLKAHPWFGGSEFSSADIMMLFPLCAATRLNLVDCGQFPAVTAWKAKAASRPAYQRVLSKARPARVTGALPPLARPAAPTPPMLYSGPA
jgi:glutathione S-transferase